MKIKKMLPAVVLSLFAFNSWSHPNVNLGIPAIRVTGEDIESDQKVLWVEGESFFQGTCPINAKIETMNNLNCNIHTQIPLKDFKVLLGNTPSKDIEEYLEILRKPFDSSMVNTPAWNKYFKKFSATEIESGSADSQAKHDFSQDSWNFKVLNVVAEYEKSQVQKQRPVGYLAHLQKLNRPVVAHGKKWAVVSRDHSLLGKRVEANRRQFDYYYLNEWLDADEVERLGINKLSPHILYTCENVFGKGWRSPSINELDEALSDLRESSLQDLIGHKTVISNQRYLPHPDAPNMAYMFSMRWSRRHAKTSSAGGARLCVQK